MGVSIGQTRMGWKSASFEVQAAPEVGLDSVEPLQSSEFSVSSRSRVLKLES